MKAHTRKWFYQLAPMASAVGIIIGAYFLIEVSQHREPFVATAQQQQQPTKQQQQSNGTLQEQISIWKKQIAPPVDGEEKKAFENETQ